MLKRDQEQLTVAARALEIVSAPLLIFDTETTGLKGEIVQISILDGEGEIKLNQLIRPENGIPAASTNIHQITEEMVQDAPTFPEVYPVLRELMEGQMVLAYNLAFDSGRLSAMCEMHQLEDISALWSGSECVMLLCATYYGDWNAKYQSFRWQKLERMMEYFGLTWEGHAHDALADIRATLQVLRALATVDGLHRLPF